MNPEVDTWYTYIVLCKDRTLYTGITKYPAKRVAAHNSARGGAKYTRPRRPVRLVYLEAWASRSEAARREHEIKAYSRAEKRGLISRGARSPVLPGDGNDPSGV